MQTEKEERHVATGCAIFALECPLATRFFKHLQRLEAFLSHFTPQSSPHARTPCLTATNIHTHRHSSVGDKGHVTSTTIELHCLPPLPQSINITHASHAPPSLSLFCSFFIAFFVVIFWREKRGRNVNVHSVYTLEMGVSQILRRHLRKTVPRTRTCPH